MEYLDTLLSGQLLFATLVTGAMYALVAVGLNLVYGSMRLLNVAHGDTLTLGAYASYVGVSLLGVSPFIAAPAAAALGGLWGYALYRGVFRGLLARLGGQVVAVETNSLLLFFGLSIVLQNGLALVFTPATQSLEAMDVIVHLGEVSMVGNRLWALACAAGVCLAIALTLKFSAQGLALRALIEHRDAAQVVGADIDFLQRMSFIVGYATAALAGALVATLQPFSPFAGFPFTIAAFIVIILGGLGRIQAGIACGFLLAAIETYGVALTSTNLRSVLLYGVFVLALLLFPRGLWARKAAR